MLVQLNDKSLSSSLCCGCHRRHHYHSQQQRRGCHRHGRHCCDGHHISLQAEQLGGGGGKRVSEKVLPFKRWSNSSSRPRIITSNIRNIEHQREVQPCQVRFNQIHPSACKVNISQHSLSCQCTGHDGLGLG